MRTPTKTNPSPITRPIALKIFQWVVLWSDIEDYKEANRSLVCIEQEKFTGDLAFQISLQDLAPD